MSNLFARGDALLARGLQSAGAVTVTYGRASTGQSATVTTAVVGRTLFASNRDGPRVEWGERDYLIPVADLVLGGVAAEPREGDRVTETIDGGAVTFRVATPETGEPAFRYSDPGRTVWRIHVTRVG